MTEFREIIESNIKIQSEEGEQPKQAYRVYKKNTGVSENYRINHINQTYEHVKKMHSEVFPLGKWKMDILEIFNLLDDIVDDSDPDTKRKQLTHALQTGEACRKFYPEKDWFHLLGFVHDLGKVLSHEKMHNLPQWTVVGDTFPVGCAFSDKCVYPEFFQENPDSKHEIYGNKFGIYKEGIGFDNVLMSFGHDEYLYQVLKNNDCLLPDEALYVIRYHSFYPWHQESAYDYLASDVDKERLNLLKEFQKCDLYSKVDEEVELETTLPYYQDLLKKYFPSRVLNW
jgi:inositol oxygenase